MGTQSTRTNLAADASAGATNIKVRNVSGFVVGANIIIGTPTSKETVTVSAVSTAGPSGGGIDFTPAIAQAHSRDETVIVRGTGLDLAAPLKFNHAANLPFSDRGTGISFQPATAFAHSSNEPVQALGTGITLDRALNEAHAINSVVRDSAVITAGYQGTPNQWFGGPELTSNVPFFGRTVTLREGSVVLRDTSGFVVDSLNYGGLVDPWAAEGYQGTSGFDQSGCYVSAPGPTGGFTPVAGAINQSAGRFPDGADTDSNCNDFLTQAATTLAAASDAGATNIKVASVRGFDIGQKIMIDTGRNVETAEIAKVGTAGATTVDTSTDVGAIVIPVASVTGFRDGQTIIIDNGTNSETAVVASVRRFGTTSVTVTTPLTHAHAGGARVSGTGIDLATALTRAHAVGAQVYDNLPTPGAPNNYLRRLH